MATKFISFFLHLILIGKNKASDFSLCEIDERRFCTTLQFDYILFCFLSFQAHPLDVQYFDKTFTKEQPKLTVIDPDILSSMDQTQFQGFSFTNPNATID